VTWLKDLGYRVEKMEGPLYTGNNPPKGTKAQYRASFRDGNGLDWEVWRYARPDYGDILELGWLDSEGGYRYRNSVKCAKGEIKESNVKSLMNPRD
jgi:hypothetical protein